ncbi:unnamed protein product [Hydatigera taeniaeformis]|uniref:Dynein intermediate chain 3, ciliary n=1 Tax=Hydatigena taeniaeformis TaxID=6205 RepID=A0A158RDK3_HYDTA|nr:unnamed protein product [Hydatigera taeniaeformis]
MLTYIEKLNPEAFAILDGQDSHVVLAPDLPTWDDNQPSQYRKSHRQPHRLLRLPDTNSFPVQESLVPIRAATWRICWPEICRGTCACVGISIHPNTPGSSFDRLLYWDLAHCSPSRLDAQTQVNGLPAADFTMTLGVRWTGCRLLEASLTYHFAELPPSAARTLRREVWLERLDVPSVTLSPFISTAWGFAEIEMQFVGFLRHDSEVDAWSNLEQRVKDLPFPKNVRNQFRLFKKRADFGKQCNFFDRASEIHADIPPNPELAEQFILRNPVSRGIQHASEMSEHEVNTERVLSEVRGINHTEGGWPKDVNHNEPEQVQRYRKKIEKDELYATALNTLASSVEHCIKQNNALNIYEEYFDDTENDASEEPPSARLVNVFRPEAVLKRAYSILAAKGLWDRRKGSFPVESSPVENSHRDPAWQVIWIQSKTGTEFFSTSTDGQVLWWDVRKMNEPMEILYLDPTKNQDLNCSIGAYALEYEPTIPTKFMAGTEQGMIISCNRKGKSPAEKVAAVFPGHKGPVYALQRNPFFTKFFLSVGDWSARIWSEDMKDDPIMWTPYHDSGATDGCWSPVRPALFFMTRLNGHLELWDYVFKQREPTLNIKISEDSLHCVRVNEEGQLVAVGSRSGVTTILELSGGFTTAAKNEKATVGAMFERETHREKILETRAKELRVKEKQRAMAEAAAAGGPTAPTQGSRPIEVPIENVEKKEVTDGETAGEKTEDKEEKEREGEEEEEEKEASVEELSPEELLNKVEEDFFDMIEEERRKRERDNNERSRRLESLNGAGDDDEEEEEEDEEEEDETEAVATVLATAAANEHEDNEEDANESEEEREEETEGEDLAADAIEGAELPNHTTPEGNEAIELYDSVEQNEVGLKIPDSKNYTAITQFYPSSTCQLNGDILKIDDGDAEKGLHR